MGKEARKCLIPGTTGLCIVKWVENPIGHTMYRRLMGKMMFLVVKIFPEGANVARELARHFLNPGPIHWEELARYIGYLKAEEKKI